MKSNAGTSSHHHTVNSMDSKPDSRRSIFIALVLLAFSILLPTPPLITPNRVLAADGDPVQSFGTNGFVAMDFAGGNDAANAIAATLNGRIVAAGSATVPGKGTDFALACYDKNGSLDPAFGNGGRVTTDFFGANDGARGVVVQEDGKLVLAGFATNGSERQFALARFNADGSPDSTFGQNGRLVLDLGSTSEAFKVALQDGGKIVVVGESRPQVSLDFTVARLNPADGSLDTSFGNNGVARIDFGNSDRATSLAIDDKNIFVAGVAVKSASDSDFAIARLNISDGSLNNEFDDDGKITVDFLGKQDSAQAIIIRDPIAPVNEPHIVVGGFATNETSDFALWVAHYRGRNVSLFNEGKTTVDFNGGRDLIFGLINQPDGDIIASGWAGVGTNFDLGIIKWDGTGKQDVSFGLQGKNTFDTAAGGNNVAFDAMLCEDTIITAGVGLNPITGNDDFILTQHENEKFVEFTKRAPAAPVVTGDFITYTFEITNFTDKEMVLKVVDFLPGGVTFENARNPEWSRSVASAPNVVERNLSVAGGKTSLFALRVRADRAGSHINTANLFYFSSYVLYEGVKYSFGESANVGTEVKEPEITDVRRDGKNLKLTGLFGDSSGANQSSAIVANALEPHAACPIILFDGVEQKTLGDPDNPSTVLIVKKGFKKIAPGQTVIIKVRLCNGTETAGFAYRRPQ
jgi:uncharacterized delta-60 repeat protein/uncharacterized repeat protein (TIGR01451 family)